MSYTTLDRVTACLRGIAIGDAIGKQTETLSRAQVTRWYPQGVAGFEGIPGTIIPRYQGSLKHEWRIGEITDDTERTLAVARAIIQVRTVEHSSIGRELLRCTKCVHPGVKSLWEFHQSRDPTRIAIGHDGCGAAVRVAPVGMVYPPEAIEELVNGAREASISTHGGAIALAAAAANAAAVSAAVEGCSAEQVLQMARHAADIAESRRADDARFRFSNAIDAVHEVVASLPAIEPDAVAARCVPLDTVTIVPLALALASTISSVEQAVLLAANIGGDSDSVASIAGGILGAMYPATVNREWCEIVERVNGFDLDATARALVQLRPRTGGSR